MKTHMIKIDRSKSLAEEPGTGHNRWHEAIPPALRVQPGDTVVMETRDAFDGQITPSSTAEDVRGADLMPVHPLTGPVYVEGAEPGDLLEVRIEEIRPEPFGFTAQIPGFGFLGDVRGLARGADSGRAVHGRHRGGPVRRVSRDPARPRGRCGEPWRRRPRA